jgi:NAD(P)-dependent dehydrogenase (short-subunit alcohol dehydrogenase family)
MNPVNEIALIVGAGDGLSASLARLFAKQKMNIGLVARNTAKLKQLCDEIGAKSFACDVTQPMEVEKLFAQVDAQLGAATVVVYNPSFRTRGALVDLNPDDVAKALAVTAYGGFLVGQQAAKRMLANKRGAILFTGASASVKGYAQSAPFAMGKFALRGLAQSMARELSPHNIHVAHFIIDGGIRPTGKPVDASDAMLEADAIAQTYLHVLQQPRSAWAHEIDLRPWVEKF